MGTLIEFPTAPAAQTASTAEQIAIQLEGIANAIRHGAFEFDGCMLSEPDCLTLVLGEAGKAASISMGRFSVNTAAAVINRLTVEKDKILSHAQRVRPHDL